MPFEIPLAEPVPRHNMDVDWPPFFVTNINTAISLNDTDDGVAFNGGIAPGAATVLVEQSTGAGATVQWQGHRGMPAARLDAGVTPTNAALAFTGIRVPVALGAAIGGNYAAGCALPDGVRIFRYRILLSFGMASPSAGTGIALIAGNAITDWIPLAGAPGFGIVGNGAGGLNFLSTDAAGATLETAAINPALFDLSKWNLFEIYLLNGTPTSLRSNVSFFINNQGAVSPRFWEVVPTLLASPFTSTNSLDYRLHIRSADAAGDLFVQYANFRAGAWDRALFYRNGL